MSASAYRCLPCRLKTATQNVLQQSSRRRLHAGERCAEQSRTAGANEQASSPTKPLISQPAYPEVSAEAERVHSARNAQIKKLAKGLKPYTAREKQLLARRYTPAQMEAIEAGEKAVSAEDMVKYGRLRGDAYRPQYIDDYAIVRPVVDEPVPGAHQGSPGGKLPIPGGLSSQVADEDDPHMLRLCQQTGMTVDEVKKIRVKNLVNHRVVNQTRMGKIQSLYFLTIAGNGKGMVGIGEGKAAEDEDGRRQAMMNAIRNMKPIPRYENRTIYGEVEGKVGATVVKLSSRPPGFGNRCQSLVYELARAAGISDLAARTPRSRNKMNVVKAAFQALTNQRLPEDVALARGRKMVDVRSVYYGGVVN